MQLRRELEAILDYKEFEKAEQSWKEYEPKIERQASLEGRSQPKLLALTAAYMSEVEAEESDGKWMP